MSNSFKRFLSSFLCLLSLFSLISCESESVYYTSEIETISVEEYPVNNNTSEETSMTTSDNSSNNSTNNQTTITSQNQSNNNQSVNKQPTSDSEKPYKYEYEFFDSRHYNYSLISKGNPARVKQVFKKVKSGKKITIAFIGGSITEGTGGTAQTCFSALVANWFEKSFGKNNINYINAGIGTAGSLFGVHRVEKDVLSHNPDIVFVDFAVNDKGKDIELETATFDALIQKMYNSKSKPAIISVAMATEQKINSQASEADICKKYQIPMLSYSNYIHAIIASGKFRWSDTATDNVHPNKVGHKIISELIIYYLEDVFANLQKSDPALASTITNPHTPESKRFITAKRLDPTEIKTTSNKGFTVSNDVYQYTKGYIESNNKNAEITFTVKTKTLTLFFAKLPPDGGTFEVYIDGKLNGEYACRTSDTWEYINSKVVAYFDTVGSHTITIKNTSQSGERILISGIGITS